MIDKVTRHTVAKLVRPQRISPRACLHWMLWEMPEMPLSQDPPVAKLAHETPWGSVDWSCQDSQRAAPIGFSHKLSLCNFS